MLKPWASKERAFRIWSPRLLPAESGISRLGFFKASSSQMALAPALDTTTSAMAKTSFSSDFKYSNWV